MVGWVLVLSFGTINEKGEPASRSLPTAACAIALGNLQRQQLQYHFIYQTCQVLPRGMLKMRSLQKKNVEDEIVAEEEL
jgi:hypothetical protein